MMVSTEQSTSTLRYVDMAHYLAGIQSELWPLIVFLLHLHFCRVFLYAMEHFGNNFFPML